MAEAHLPDGVGGALRVTQLRRAWLREMGIERIWGVAPAPAMAVAAQPAVQEETMPARSAAAGDVVTRAPAAVLASPVPPTPQAARHDPEARSSRSPAREAVEMARRAAGLQQRGGAGGRAARAEASAVPAAASPSFLDKGQGADASLAAVAPAGDVPMPLAEPAPQRAPGATAAPERVTAQEQPAPARSSPDDTAQHAPLAVGNLSPVVHASTDLHVQRASAADPAWDTLKEEVMGCVACGLCESRTQPVFGVGPRNARWMVVGEAPGEQEDRQGDPFVGRSGQLLDSMLAAVGLSRQQDVFIANVIKCRPPGNRNPKPEEVATCSPYLMRQMALLKPERILLLGSFAAQTLLNTQASVGSLRGKVHTLAIEGGQVPAVVSYHPAYLLRSPHEKARAWQDLRLAVSAAA